MTADCILFYGNHMLPTMKYAGTFRIATQLRNFGYTVQCIDLTSFDGHTDRLSETIKSCVGSNTLWVGISTTFLYHILGYPYYRSENTFKKKYENKPDIDKGILEFTNLIKKLNPKTKLIAGGSRRFMLERYGFKIFKKNNDTEIIEFTDYCAKKAKKIPAEFFGNVIEGSEYQEFHKSQNIFIKNDIVEIKDSLPIEISRGCIFKCKFCSFPLNGKKKGDWVKNSNVLYDEFLKNYELHGVTDYTFSDDTYNDSEEKVKRLYDEVYSKLPFKLNFTTYIRLDLMIRFPDTVKYLQESGLRSAVFGIETINHESGKSIGKGVNPLEQFQFIEDIKKNEFKEIMTFSGFILGLPKDREDELEKLEEFLFSEKNKLDDFVVEPLFIMPKQFENVNRNYFSEFDLEYEKYGYECYEQIEDSAYNEIRWTNSITGMTFDRAYRFSRIINQKMFNSDRFKMGGFAFPWAKSLGVSSEDLLQLSRREIHKKYNFSVLLEKKKASYRSNLSTILSEKKDVL
jgi:radical SAM superfamily enzyme YgiQ (UPF0313 family)